MKLIVNIPAYNEEVKIGETITRIRESFSDDFYSQGEGKNISQKLIQVVDDGSSDNTVGKAREAGAQAKHRYQQALEELSLKTGTLLNKYWGSADLNE